MSAWMKLDGIGRQVAIAGIVRNAQTRQGIAGVQVQITGMPAALRAKIDLLAQLYSADWDRRKERLDRTQTRPDGYFYFLDLPDGDYTLSADWPEAGTRYGRSEPQNVTVSRDSEGEINNQDMLTIDLPPTSLKGKIKDAEGQDVVMAKVRLEGSSEYTYSDGKGNYSLIGLEASDQPRKVHVNWGYQSQVVEIVLTKGQVQTVNMPIVEGRLTTGEGIPNNRPPVTNGLKVYLSGESLTSERWEDLSGNQNHATQAENSSRPQLHQVTGYNGKDFAVARFDSEGGLVISDSLSLEKPFTVIVIDRYYGEEKRRTLQSRDNNWLVGKWGGKNGCYMESEWVGSEAAVVGEFDLNTVTLEESSPKWYLNGVLKGESGGTTAPGRLGLCGGGKYREMSEADIACVLIYNRVLSDAERKNVEGWLGDRYGIELTNS